MHELAIGQAIVDTVRRHADGRPVTRVEVRIGHFRQVVPDALQFSWEMLTADTDLAGCELVIAQVPAVVSCTACSAETRLDWPILLCEQCGSTDVVLISGEEFDIASIDRAQEVC